MEYINHDQEKKNHFQTPAKRRETEAGMQLEAQLPPVHYFDHATCEANAEEDTGYSTRSHACIGPDDARRTMRP